MYVAASSLSGTPGTMSTGQTAAVYGGIAGLGLLTFWLLFRPQHECTKLHRYYCAAVRASDKREESAIRARAGSSRLRCSWADSPSCYLDAKRYVPPELRRK